jgi:riboflavin-specific deaminase-like protein
MTLAASALAAGLDAADADAWFVQSASGELLPAAGDEPAVVLIWRRGQGWESRLPAGDPRTDILDLYLPLCSATPARPITVGHLGQSVDGFIATHSGDSQFVTGHENIVHLHALRALCDAVVVGAGTVAADDPQLTTRHVTGPHPLRVVFDPTRRLTDGYRVFTDPASPTLYVCEQERLQPGGTRVGHAEVAGISTTGDGGAVGALLRLLRARGCARVFVEGGGVTVSAFLEANLLDRLHLAIAPVLIGEGRPAIRLTARDRLRDCARPRYRVFRMGGDVLFDYDLGASAPVDLEPLSVAPRVSRII